MRKYGIILITIVIVVAVLHVARLAQENAILKKYVARLEADSRIAEVLVTDVQPDAAGGAPRTTIKFLEYDVKGNALTPRYFTFQGNVIQFQSLVVRFDDVFVKKNHPLKGKSAYLFWKVFMLNGPRTQEYDIGTPYEIPAGYKLEHVRSGFEKKLWQHFWDYALDARQRARVGVKNAQIEAPGTRFVPGMLYTIKIEHDGGMRIDAEPLPAITRGERIP